MTMTVREKRVIVRSLGVWEPQALSIELTDADRKSLREQAAEVVASCPAIDVDLETALVWVDSARMS